MYDLIIIGGGPAGITAGIYASRQRLKTLLITKEFGGQVATKSVDIENYPGFVRISGSDLIKKFEEHLRDQDVEIENDKVVKIERSDKRSQGPRSRFIVLTGRGKRFESTAVIIASGADPRPLEAPGEKEFIGKGVSYCPHCDGPIFRDKTVAVIGGGNAGFEAAIFLSNYVKKIYILEYSKSVKADKENQQLVEQTGIVKVITSAELKEIRGDNFVNSIVYKDLKSSEEKTLEVEGIFVEIGTQPATAFAKGLVELNERDEIKVEFETCQTKTPGLFAVGDANVGKYKQIVTAAGEGAKAALAAYEYIKKTKPPKNNYGKNQ